MSYFALFEKKNQKQSECPVFNKNLDQMSEEL